jgi:Zinc-binding dehydrogenase
MVNYRDDSVPPQAPVCRTGFCFVRADERTGFLASSRSGGAPRTAIPSEGPRGWSVCGAERIGSLKEAGQARSGGRRSGGTLFPSADSRREDGARLWSPAALLDDGTLQVHIHDTFEFDRATDALQALATERVRGKLAISVR